MFSLPGGTRNYWATRKNWTTREGYTWCQGKLMGHKRTTAVFVNSNKLIYLFYFWFLSGRTRSTRSTWSCGRVRGWLTWTQGESSSGLIFTDPPMKSSETTNGLVCRETEEPQGPLGHLDWKVTDTLALQWVSTCINLQNIYIIYPFTARMM